MLQHSVLKYSTIYIHLLLAKLMICILLRTVTAVVSGEMDEKLPREVTEHVLYDEYEYEETDPLTGE